MTKADEFKQLFQLSCALSIVLLGVFSPFIYSALTAHKNPEFNVHYLNGKTGESVEMPCPLGFRIFMALIFCLPSIGMIVFGPIAAMAFPRITDRIIETVFKE